MSNLFEWKRFWCPRGAAIDLSDDGFLFDPDSEYGKFTNPELVTFESLATTPALALLGEPGIGKSSTLEAELANLDSADKNQGTLCHKIDLRGFGSEDRLWKAIFEGEEIKKWRNDDYTLTLFLDSLDECLLRISNVATLIADQLANEPVNRLRLRVACRTAPWPMILENSLTRLFGVDGFKAFELAPLRQRDVRHAAGHRGISDPDIFLSRIKGLNAASLAIKPVTLNFLINSYLLDGDLPTSQVELYEKGCRILCEESNESRVGAGQRGTLNAGQRLAIASRIAAITQFGNRYAVWTASEAGPIPPEDIRLDEIGGGTENPSQEVVVTSDTIREVLDTGLFSSRGASRIGWAHQTYAEFLAAYYCRNYEIAPQQIRSLIFHPSEGGERLIPQLHELAAWISVLNPPILEMVANSDPEALLGAAGASLSNIQRKLVAKAILAQCERGRPLNLRWGMHQLYEKLKHPELAVQLKPYIRSAHNQGTRYVAIEMALSSGVTELGDELAAVALNTLEEASLRSLAAVSAARIGSREVRERLRPLAYGQAGDDSDDELKGSGMLALWPELISAKDLFPLLTRPKPHLSGVYSTFLYNEVLKHLNPSDLLPALEWFSNQSHRSFGPVERLMDDVVRLAWDNLDQTGIAIGLANAILSRVRIHDQLLHDDKKEFRKEWATNHARRQTLLAEILPRLKDNNELFYLTHAGAGPVMDEDFLWIINRLVNQESPSSQSIEAHLARRLVDTWNPEQMKILWTACQKNPILNAEVRDLFQPISLNSEQARILRENFRDQRAAEEEKLLDPPPKERIERDLHQIEQGNLDSWIQLTSDLSLRSDSKYFEDNLHPDLTALQGWKSATDETKQRIVDAAFHYSLAGDPQNERWFKTSQIFHSAIAGFRALALLLTLAPEKFAAIPVQAWQEWIPIILQYPHGRDERNLREQLLREAHRLVPHDVTGALVQLITFKNETSDYFSLDSELELSWSTELGAELLDKVRRHELKPDYLRAILQILLKHQIDGVREAARAFISTPPPDLDLPKNLMIAAIKALMTSADDAGWSDVWPITRDNLEFGRLIIGSISYAAPRGADFLKKLSDPQLGEFCTWMLTVFPPSGSDHRSSGAMGTRETSIMLRDHALEHLKKRSSFTACQAIKGMLNVFPQYSWLTLYLEEAESLARAATWRPIQPGQFLELISNRSKRLIENPEQLIEVVVESLERLNAKLHGELPASKDLWNAEKGDCWPKDEEDLSDYVARHLDEDIQDRGIVVNREVQIRRGTGGGTGESTDIHVDALLPGVEPGTYARVYLIIETKGNWHAKVFGNMETQLRDRYLLNNRCKTGIYLIGWFSGVKWKDQDPRKKQCPTISIEEARRRFSEQAKKLSLNGFDIKSYVLDCSL